MEHMGLMGMPNDDTGEHDGRMMDEYETRRGLNTWLCTRDTQQAIDDV